MSGAVFRSDSAGAATTRNRIRFAHRPRGKRNSNAARPRRPPRSRAIALSADGLGHGTSGDYGETPPDSSISTTTAVMSFTLRPLSSLMSLLPTTQSRPSSTATFRHARWMREVMSEISRL